MKSIKIRKKIVELSVIALVLLQLMGQVGWFKYIAIFIGVLAIIYHVKFCFNLKVFSNKRYIIVFIFSGILLFRLLQECLKYNHLFNEIGLLVLIFSLFTILYISDISILTFKNRYLTTFIAIELAIVTYYILQIIISSNFSVLFLNVDKNYVSLNLISLFIILVILNFNKNKSWIQYLINIILLIIILLVIFSGSRRGILVISGIVILTFIVALIRNNFKKFRVLFLSLFLSISLLSVFLFFPLLGTLRTYFTEVNFEKPNVIKNQVASIVYRYSDAIKPMSFKEVYNKLWVKDGDRNIITKPITKKLRNKIKYNYIDGEYNNAINNLYRYSIIDKSSRLKNDVLPHYFSAIPDSMFLTSNVKSIPLVYNIPYRFNNFFFPKSYSGIFPKEITREKNNKLYFNYRIAKGDSIYMFSFIPGHQAKYKFSFIMDTVNLAPKIMVRDKDARKIRYSIEKEFFEVRGNKKKVTIEFKTFEQRISYRLYLLWNETKTENLFIGDFELKNIEPFRIGNTACLSKRDINQCYGLLINSKEEYINRYNIFFSRFNNYVENEKIDSSSLQSIIKNISTTPVYNEFSEPVLLDGTYFFYDFTQSKYYFKKRVPTINDLKINLSVDVSISTDAFIETKLYRFPNKNPEFLKFKVFLDTIYPLNDKWKHIQYSYITDSSSTGLGQFLVLFKGIKPFTDTIKVKNFKIEPVLKSKQLKDLTKYPYLRPYLLESKIDSIKNIQLRLREKFRISKDKETFFDTRFLRWKASLEYFKTFNIKEKIFGKGMEYTRVFPLLFYNGHQLKGIDYPHNPIISAFLYSGIIGGLIYIIFLVVSFIRYWKQRENLWIFGIIYLLIFFFTFFSGNTHFSVPALAIFSLIPFMFKINNN